MIKDFMNGWNMSKCLFCKHCDSKDKGKLKAGFIFCLKKEIDMTTESYCDDWRYRF